jgi:hypothetical protein
MHFGENRGTYYIRLSCILVKIVERNTLDCHVFW